MSTDVFDPSALFGWVDHPDRLLMARPFGTLFSVAPDYQDDTSNEKDVFLYKAWAEVLGKYPSYPAQEIGDCFPAGTIVFGKTVQPIESVNIGDAVWTAEGKLTKVVSKRAIVTAKPMVRITSVGGMPVTCTADHRFLVYRIPRVHGKRVSSNAYRRVSGTCSAFQTGVAEAYEARSPQWVAAGELTTDDCLLSPIAFDVPPPPIEMERYWLSPKSRWVLGYFLGNGHASAGTVEVAYPDEAIGDDLVQVFTHHGYKAAKADYRKDCGARRVRVHCVHLVESLRRQFYASDGSKAFPAWALGDSDFLSGLKAADGTVNGKTHSLDTTSLSVAYGAIFTLTILGQRPTINRAARSKGTYGNAKPLWRINWRPGRNRAHIWQDEQFLCRPVRKVEWIEGPELVYDIGVEDPHHSFLANGHAVHNCTSFGAGHALDLLQCIEIATGEPEEFKEISTEAIYGIGREIAGMLRGGDGCYGSAVARALAEFGAVPREEVGSYAGSRAKEWGRKGVPAAIKEKCKAHMLGSATLVTTLAELDAALNNGKPVTVASNQGFSMTRDSEGVCDPQGSWAHQMFICARRRKGQHYLLGQSWGDNAPQGPLSDDQPKFSFWAPGKTVARMLAVKDSWAFSLWGGFQRKDLPPGWSYMGMA